MPYLIATTNTVIIDGDEMNAGDRAFVKDARAFILDGAETGTAASRMFMKDHKLFTLEGGFASLVAPRVNQHAIFAIEGPPSDNSVHVFPLTFVIDGRPGPTSTVSAQSTSAYIIDTLPQETPP